MNVLRMLRIRDQILAEPERLEMADYVGEQYDDTNEMCGTTLCIGARAALDAAFIVLRDTPRPGTPRTFYDVTPEGLPHGSEMLPLSLAALSLNEAEGRRLFHVEHWPAALWGAFLRAKTASVRAEIAVKRIDHFLRTEGRE